MASQMGHADAEMLLKVYAKWIKSAQSQVEMPREFRQHAPHVLAVDA